ncbi:MAG: glycosyltransferase family 4 protein [Burkholderiales bacterium]
MIPATVYAVVVPPLLAFIVSSALIAVILRSRVAALTLDHPNERSLHAVAVPRTGGIGIVAGIAAACVYLQPAGDPWLWLALALLIAVSLVDDLRGVRVAWRLLMHVAGAVVAATVLLGDHAWWLMVVAALAIAWMINLYNFMDGADGLAGGMAVIGFGSYGVAALAGGDITFAAVNLSIATAALGFLFFNFPPARIFMGDAGAIPLGFLAAVVDIAGCLRGDWPWWLGLVIFSPFIVDASITLMKRLLRGTRVWQAHREHYYQRLVQSGWGHRKTAYAEYALMLPCSALALLGMRQSFGVQMAILFSVAIFYAGLAIALERHFFHTAASDA